MERMRIANVVVVLIIASGLFVPVVFDSPLDVRFASSIASAQESQNVTPSARSSSRPPSGLWGETLQDGNDKGLKKATGAPYNYTHIALSAGLIAIVGFGLMLLIRRHASERALGQQPDGTGERS